MDLPLSGESYTSDIPETVSRSTPLRRACANRLHDGPRRRGVMWLTSGQGFQRWVLWTTALRDTTRVNTEDPIVGRRDMSKVQFPGTLTFSQGAARRSKRRTLIGLVVAMT